MEKEKEPKECPIYGTIYCPMCWISYGFEKIYLFRDNYHDVFNEKQRNLIENLLPEEKWPGCFKNDHDGIAAYFNVCPHWNYFILLGKNHEKFNYQKCGHYKRYKKLGDKILDFYKKLANTKNPYSNSDLENNHEEIEKKVIVKEIENKKEKISTDKNWKKFKAGMVPIRGW